MTNKYLISTVLVALALTGCASSYLQRGKLRCEYLDFQQSDYDHIVERMPEVVRARNFRGRIRARPEDLPGPWPRNMNPRLELHGLTDFSEFVDITEEGQFARERLLPGTYCFKISAIGFRSVIGHVVIDPRANPDAEIDVIMLLAQ